MEELREMKWVNAKVLLEVNEERIQQTWVAWTWGFFLTHDSCLVNKWQSMGLPDYVPVARILGLEDLCSVTHGLVISCMGLSLKSIRNRQLVQNMVTRVISWGEQSPIQQRMSSDGTQEKRLYCCSIHPLEHYSLDIRLALNLLFFRKLLKMRLCHLAWGSASSYLELAKCLYCLWLCSAANDFYGFSCFLLICAWLLLVLFFCF